MRAHVRLFHLPVEKVIGHGYTRIGYHGEFDSLFFGETEIDAEPMVSRYLFLEIGVNDSPGAVLASPDFQWFFRQVGRDVFGDDAMKLTFFLGPGSQRREGFGG